MGHKNVEIKFFGWIVKVVHTRITLSWKKDIIMQPRLDLSSALPLSPSPVTLPDLFPLGPPLLEGVLLLVRPLHSGHLAVQLFNFGALRLCSSRWLGRSMFVSFDRFLSCLLSASGFCGRSADKLRSIVCNEDVCCYERVRQCCFDELYTLQCLVDVFGLIISAGSWLIAACWFVSSS